MLLVLEIAGDDVSGVVWSGEVVSDGVSRFSALAEAGDDDVGVVVLVGEVLDLGGDVVAELPITDLALDDDFGLVAPSDGAAPGAVRAADVEAGDGALPRPVLGDGLNGAEIDGTVYGVARGESEPHRSSWLLDVVVGRTDPRAGPLDVVSLLKLMHKLLLLLTLSGCTSASLSLELLLTLHFASLAGGVKAPSRAATAFFRWVGTMSR